MVFNNENIRRLRDKKTGAIVAQPIAMPSPTPPMSKAPTAESIAGATAPTAVDLESHLGPGHWFFGMQIATHPYSLLLAILDCLQAMGFVYFGGVIPFCSDNKKNKIEMEI